PSARRAVDRRRVAPRTLRNVRDRVGGRAPLACPDARGVGGVLRRVGNRTGGSRYGPVHGCLGGSPAGPLGSRGRAPPSRGCYGSARVAHACRRGREGHRTPELGDYLPRLTGFARRARRAHRGRGRAVGPCDSPGGGTV